MDDLKTLRMELGERSYEIYVGASILDKAKELFNLERRIIVVTDSGVPSKYSARVAELCAEAKIITFPETEASKNIDTFALICQAMLDFGLQRKDAVIAVGGGVVGDIAGFCAATYMRGVDFYNIPTTLLSSVDSSIGGKTAVDFGGVKNILGAFYQPKGVLIDTNLLKTLDSRQMACGKAEIIKMALSRDRELFEKIEKEGITESNITDIIFASLKIKKNIVELDEREGGLRKILNLGHTLGHGIEATTELLHGECVALGMIPMCSPETRVRLKSVLKREGLPYQLPHKLDLAFEFMKHDKKRNGTEVDAIFVSEVGVSEIRRISLSALEDVIMSSI